MYSLPHVQGANLNLRLYCVFSQTAAPVTIVRQQGKLKHTTTVAQRQKTDKTRICIRCLPILANVITDHTRQSKVIQYKQDFVSGMEQHLVLFLVREIMFYY